MIRLTELISEFRTRFVAEPLVFSAPGRVNLIGEHTDYNQGFVLPFAIDKRTYVLASGRSDRRINAYTRTLDKEVEFSIDEAFRSNGWSQYLRGIASVLKREIDLTGSNLIIDSEIPFGAGLSSSAALEIASGLALSTMAGDPIDRTDLAFAGQTVEHEFVGVKSGIMDQFASALCQRDHALLIDCRSFETQNIPLELKDLSLVVCDSKVKHELASGEYNKRRQQCEEGVATLQHRSPEVRSLRDASIEMLNDAADDLSPILFKRCRHVITEDVRTLQLVTALKKGDLDRVGQLMYASHASLRDDYEVSCPELDLLVDTASTIDGVAGSRMTGGGFGGSTITLIKKGAIAEFTTAVVSQFTSRFGHDPEIFVVRPSDGARQEKY